MQNDFINDQVLDKIYENELLDGYYDYVEITNCTFKKCNFTNSKFNGIDITNSLFEMSNLSNIALLDHTYNNIKFINCNLLGTTFIDSYLDNIEFINCNLKYSNFSGTNLKNIKFDEIIYNKDINLTEEEYKFMREIINKTKYILINSDEKIKIPENILIKIITFGFNQKSTLSISSIKEDYIIISVQRDIEKINKQKIENQERKIEISPSDKISIYKCKVS